MSGRVIAMPRRRGPHDDQRVPMQTALRALSSREDDVLRRIARRIVARCTSWFTKDRAIGRLLPRSVPREAARLHAWSTSSVSVHHGARPARTAMPQALLVTHDLSRSGAPKIVVELAEVFAAAGFGVTVVAPHVGPLLETLIDTGAFVVVDPHVLDGKTQTLATLARSADVALCNTVVTRVAVQALHAVLPTFWYIHEVSLLRDLLVRDDTVCDALAVAFEVWCGSEMSAQLVRPCRSDVRVVPYGLSPLARLPGDPPQPDDARIRITVFGSIERRKGQDLAAHAIALLSPAQRQAVVLTFHGRTLEPDFASDLRRQAQHLPVTFGGELGPNDYRLALLASDVVLVCSRDDTLPLVSLDALGAARVLACTPTIGTAAYLTQGVDGFVAVDATAEAIAEMLATVIAERRRWTEIGADGRLLFARTFSKRSFADLVLSRVRHATGSDNARDGVSHAAVN